MKNKLVTLAIQLILNLAIHSMHHHISVFNNKLVITYKHNIIMFVRTVTVILN